MSVRVQSWVWRYSRATGNALIVLLKIADNADDDGSNAWPSIAYLAEMCRCSEMTVRRAIAVLKELGELEVDLQAGGGRRTPPQYRPNRYRVVMQGYQSDTPPSRGTRTGVQGYQNRRPGVTPVVPNSSLTIQNPRPGVEKLDHSAWAQRARDAFTKPTGRDRSVAEDIGIIR